MKKILSLTLVLITIFSLSACKKTDSTSSDVESDLLTSTNESIAETENSKSEPEVNDEESSVTNVESDQTLTNTVTDKTLESSSHQSSVVSTPPQAPAESNKTPVKNETSTNKPTARQKMTGKWSFTIPENTITSDFLRDPGFRFVYEITITNGEDILVAEKEYICSDTLTYGEIKFFDGKRYTLANDSVTMVNGYKGLITTSKENENVAILKLWGEDLETGRISIEETHYLTLIDDTHLKWTKCEIHSERLEVQYFPWDTSTVFTKN